MDSKSCDSGQDRDSATPVGMVLVPGGDFLMGTDNPIILSDGISFTYLPHSKLLFISQNFNLGLHIIIDKYLFVISYLWPMNN